MTNICVFDERGRKVAEMKIRESLTEIARRNGTMELLGGFWVVKVLREFILERDCDTRVFIQAGWVIFDAKDEW